MQECFGPRSGPCFGVETYTRRCSRLTPSRYISQYSDARSIALRRCDDCPPTTICATIPTLVEKCKFAPISFCASDRALTNHFGDECFTDAYFPYWKSFLGNVRSLEISQVTWFYPGWKYIMDAIFCSTHCKLNELCINVLQSDSKLMAFLVPYFSPALNLNTSYAHLRKVHIIGAVKSVSDASNTELILNHQNNLEVVTIGNCNCFKSGRDAPITLALTTFVKKSSFRELTLSSTSVFTSLVLKVLHEFFSSKSTNHQQLCFYRVRVMPDETAEIISTPPPVGVGSRSMEIVECELQPEIASIFPSSMSFQKLTIDIRYKQQNAVNVLDLFSHVKSLQVENMSLSTFTSNQNSKAVVNLLNLVETCNWSLHFQFVPSSQEIPENTATLVEAVTDVAPSLGQLVTKGIVTHLGFGFSSTYKLPEPVFEALLEEIFQGVQYSRSRIELDLGDCPLTYSYGSLDCLYRTWN